MTDGGGRDPRERCWVRGGSSSSWREREGGCQVLHVGVSLWGEREIKVVHGES